MVPRPLADTKIHGCPYIKWPKGPFWPSVSVDVWIRRYRGQTVLLSLLELHFLSTDKMILSVVQGLLCSIIWKKSLNFWAFAGFSASLFLNSRWLSYTVPSIVLWSGCVCVCVNIFPFPRSGNAHNNVVGVCIPLCKPMNFPKGAVPCCFPEDMHKGSRCSTFSPALCMPTYKMIVYLTISQCSFNLQFSND